MTKMIRLDDLRVFVHAADVGSFSAAARLLDLTPSLASSQVQRLERMLRCRLFVRSTRSMRLTEEGLRYLPHARAMVAADEDGRRALAEGLGEISGKLRLSAPSDLGRNLLVPWLDAFQEHHPHLSIEIHISDRAADFFSQSLDVGVRYGILADSGLIALPIAPFNRRTLCAAPAYVERHGAPAAPEDLRDHNCLRYVMGEHTHYRWSFHMPRGVQTVAVEGDRVSDDADVVRRWAVAGRGLLYKSRLDVWPDLQAGRLVELFPAEFGEPTPLQLVCVDRGALTPAVRELRAFLTARCAEMAPP